jgi:CRP-like cAMP-binding protein
MNFHTRTHEPLADLPLFDACTPAEIARARGLLTLLTVEPGTVLMREGGFGLEVAIIAGGEATVSRHTAIGEQVLATVGRGDVVGEMSVLGRDRRTATVTADSPLTIYVATVSEFSGLLDALPAVAERIARTAAERRESNRQALAA